ncbi:MAG: hypothetical protein J7M34_00660 [Anaerolineae bacterium]|nr:hypothetical protein [Anaerolineae bacterium]
MKRGILSTLFALFVVSSLLITSCAPGASQPTPVIIVVTPTPAPTRAQVAAAPAEEQAVTVVPTPTLAGQNAPPPPATATSAPSPAPSPTPAVGGERTVHVTALAYRKTSEGRAAGSAHTITVRIRRKQDPGLRVGIFNSEVEGTGPMWRASAWSAVTLSSLLLGVNPEHFEFSYDAGGGRIDGPSAGGLTTVATLAALLGDSVRDDAAMTGTINPDGTIGPVGGIPHKLEGAAKAGKKLVLIPSGQRYDYDENLKRQVDLVEVGKKLGIEVRQVKDIFEAYEILTGKPLPRPALGGTVEMPPRAFDKLRASTIAWLARYNEARNRFNSLSDEAKQDREPTYGDQQAKLAEQALQQGMAAVAQQRAWEAAWDAEASLQAATLDEVYAQKGFDGLIDQLKAVASSRQDFMAVLQSLKAERPRSACETIALMDAWSNLAIAFGYNAQADDLVNRAVQLRQKQDQNVTEDQLLDLLYEASDDYVSAKIYLDTARDSLDWGMGFGDAPAPDDHRVQVMAELLRWAADANRALFDSIVLGPQAKRAGVSLEAEQSWFMNVDESYGTALLSRFGIDALSDEVWEEPARSMMTLGASLTSWADMAMLIAKYYSLGAQVDKEGNVLRITGERALVDMLDLSEERSAELIRLAGKEDPVPPMYYSEVARIWRQGDPEDQLLALDYQWQAAVEASMLAYFTGYYGQAVKDSLERSGRPVELLQLWDLPAK